MWKRLCWSPSWLRLKSICLQRQPPIKHWWMPGEPHVFIWSNPWSSLVKPWSKTFGKCLPNSGQTLVNLALQVTLQIVFSYELQEGLDGFYKSSYKGGLPYSLVSDVRSVHLSRFQTEPTFVQPASHLFRSSQRRHHSGICLLAYSFSPPLPPIMSILLATAATACRISLIASIP